MPSRSRNPLFVLILVLLGVAVFFRLGPDPGAGFAIEARMASSAYGNVQVYYDSGHGFSEKDSTLLPLVKSTTPHFYRLSLPAGTYRALRFDPIDRDGTVTIEDARIVDGQGSSVRNLSLSAFKPYNQIQSLREAAGRLEVVVTPGGDDPQLLLAFDPALTLKTGLHGVTRGQLLESGLFLLVLLAALYASKGSPRKTWNWEAVAGWLGPDSKSTRTARLLLLAGLFFVVLGAKFHLIDHYGSDVPYWDQWDGEGETLLHPYLDGHLTAPVLLAAHTEHRILFTRLLTLGLFQANDRQWDPRLELACNAVLHTVIALLLAGFALRVLPWRAAVVYCLTAALFFGAAVSADNTLAGFQSQFYFLILFSLLHIGGTLLSRPRSWVWWLAPLAGAAALFSMASGLVSAAAILGVSGVRVLRDRKSNRNDLWIFGANLVLVASGLLLKTNVPDHAAYMAPDFRAGVDVWLYQLAWPVMNHGMALLGILPSLALLAAFLRRRVEGPVALGLLGGCAWYWLQAAAIAYSRGAFNHGYESRYTDILAIGVLLDLLVLGYLASHAPSTQSGGKRTFIAIGFAAIIVCGLARDNRATYESNLNIRPDVNAARIVAVRDYTTTHDPAFFQRTPWYELPYPTPERLAKLLDTPVLRAALPASIRPPVAIEPDPSATQGFVKRPPNGPESEPPLGLATWTSATIGENDAPAHFSSLPFAVDHSRVGILIAGSAPVKNLELRMIDDQGVAHEPLDRGFPVEERWHQVNFITPKGRTRFEAVVTGGGWFAFTQPFTDTAVSHFVQKAVGYGPGLIALGAALGLGALFRSPRRRVPEGAAAPP